MKNRKLTKLTLHNFQQHPHTVIDLHEGVNAAIGPSDSGKSTLLCKSIEWVYSDSLGGDNKYGFGVHSHNIVGKTKKGVKTLLDQTYVEIEFNDTTLLRKTKGKFESKITTKYLITHPDGREQPLTAPGNSVPEEVLDLFDFKSLNYSNQLDGHFMILQTPGKIAKELNKYADMTLASNVLTKIKAESKSVTARLKVVKEDIVELEDDLEEYNNLKEMEEQLDRLSNLHDKLNTTQESLKDLKEKQTLLLQLELELSKSDSTPKQEKALKELNILCDTLEETTKQLRLLESIYDDYIYVTEELSKYTNLDERSTNLQELKTLQEVIDSRAKYILSLKDLKREIGYVQDTLDKHEVLEAKEKRISELMNLEEKLSNTTNLVTTMKKDLNNLVEVNREIKSFASDKQARLLAELIEDEHRLAETRLLIKGMKKDLQAVRELSTTIKKLDLNITESEKKLIGQECPFCNKPL
jgi:exonuclease SbcC